MRSVVGRFLEHTRIFYFKNDGDEQVYLSSADWMDRNFFRRIETGFPILNPKLKKRVITEGLKPYLRDNVQAWDMQPDGSYRRRKPRRAKPYRAQDRAAGPADQDSHRSQTDPSGVLHGRSALISETVFAACRHLHRSPSDSVAILGPIEC